MPLPVRYTLEDLRADAESGRIEDVIVALPNLQGDLKGTRVAVDHFLAHALTDGFPACVYLLASDVEMTTAAGYSIAASDAGFGDFVLRPDMTTLRRLPWDDRTALVLGDVLAADDTPIQVAPRQILRTQLDRLAAQGLRAFAGTEPEFLIFRDSYQQAHDSGYRNLRPATRHNADYALSGLEAISPVVRDIKSSMAAAGMIVETARAECHPGQYEIVFRYDHALTTCDNHVIYKLGAKQIAERHGTALTFMAKYDAGEGNSCHVHLSLRAEDGEPVLAQSAHSSCMSALMRHFLAGQLACLAEFTLLFAPNINSYKRLQPGCFAPATISWGFDNRTCPIRVVGTGPDLRIEHRVPGGDANPYLAVAAMIAAGLYGIEQRLDPPPPHSGDTADAAGLPRLPATLREATDLWESSPRARALFGDEIVAHYAHAARRELAAFDTAVTDWEHRRGFERL